MNQYEKKILNQLLDAYEKSSLYRGDNKRTVTISFGFQKKTIPEYFDENSLDYEEIHGTIKQLEARGFIEIVWKYKKENHIIDKVILRETALPEIYRYVKRTAKLSQVENIEEIFKIWSEKAETPIVTSFLNRMQERMKQHKSIKEYMDISNPEEAEELIRTIGLVERNHEDCFVREFSIRNFRDSKKFETLIGRVCRIIREENSEFEGLENDEILAEFQIYLTPGYVYLKGNVNIELESEDESQVTKKEKINVENFQNGLGFALDRIKSQTLAITSEPGQIEKIFTIENLTTFFRFQEKNSLIIYLGGYHNSVRRNLLKKIYGTFPGTEYYHFGDIDAGGFQIYNHLKEKTGIPFEMYKMDVTTLQKYQDFGKPLSENDKKRLKYIFNQSTLESQKEVIQYMLKVNLKLEQECIVE